MASVIFVQTGGESFERRPVKLGVRDTGYAEVKEGYPHRRAQRHERRLSRLSCGDRPRRRRARPRPLGTAMIGWLLEWSLKNRLFVLLSGLLLLLWGRYETTRSRWTCFPT